MNIQLLVVGKIKENFINLGIDEYKKRLTKYCNLRIIEVNDEKIPINSSAKEEEIVKNKEGKSILKYIKDNSYVIVLSIDGKSLSSEEFSNYLSNKMIESNSNITLIIGGSLGVSHEVLERANYKLSFSKFTFPHQLMRLILLEQLYRAFKILKNETYHK